MTTMTDSTPTAPADAPSIALVGDNYESERVYATPRYTYRFASRKGVEDILSRYNGMAVLATAYEVTVDRARPIWDGPRPISSDYDPYVTGQVVLRIAYRNRDDNKVTTTLVALASMTTNGYPKSNDEAVIRSVVTSWLAGDNTPVQAWWKSLVAKVPLASAVDVEKGRTDLILELMEDARRFLFAGITDNLGRDKTINVKVVRGRKVPIGTTGNVFWVGNTQWGRRIGLKDSNGTVYWTSAGNIEITSRPDEAEVLKRAKETYSAQYATLFGSPRA